MARDIYSPVIWLAGKQFSGNPTGDTLDPAMGSVPEKGISLTWGSDNDRDQDPPSTLRFQVIANRSVSDIPDLVVGAHVSVVLGTEKWFFFDGRIRRLSAVPYGDGQLLVTVNATDYMTEFDDLYVSTSLTWSDSVTRGNDLRTIASSKDSRYSFINSMYGDSLERAPQKYNSIKFRTLAERFIAPARGRLVLQPTLYDLNVTPVATRELVTLKAVERLTGTAAPLELISRPDKTLYAKTVYTNFETDGQSFAPYFNATLEADNIVKDSAEWSMDTSDVVNALGINFPETASTGETNLVTHDYDATGTSIQTYGRHRETVDTDITFNTSGYGWAAQLQEIKDTYFVAAPYWSGGSLTFNDSRLVDERIIMLSSKTRYQLWITIVGLIPNTPSRENTITQAAMLGGSYTWDGEKWDMTFNLAKPAEMVPMAPQRKWSEIATATDPNVRNATFATMGNTLTSSDFQYIYVT